MRESISHLRDVVVANPYFYTRHRERDTLDRSYLLDTLRVLVDLDHQVGCQVGFQDHNNYILVSVFPPDI